MNQKVQKWIGILCILFAGTLVYFLGYSLGFMFQDVQHIRILRRIGWFGFVVISGIGGVLILQPYLVSQKKTYRVIGIIVAIFIGILTAWFVAILSTILTTLIFQRWASPLDILIEII